MQHRVTSHDDWLIARRDLLRAEKQPTRPRDKVSKQRHAFPWKRIDAGYIFDASDGLRTLADHDVTMFAIIRAPVDENERFRHRMGWKFCWASSNGSTFNYDFRVSFTDAEIASGQIDYDFGE